MNSKMLLIPVILLLASVTLYSNNGKLVKTEYYYGADGTTLQGYKQYRYNDRNDIVEITVYSADGVLQARFEYRYNDNRLVAINEYSAQAGNRLHYSLFIYDKKNRPLRRFDHDSDTTLRMVHTFVFDSRGRIKKIKDSSESGTNLGYREFIYKNDLLVSDNLYDESGELLITRRYSYTGTNLQRIEFYMQNRRLVRIIERNYLKDKNGSVSTLGLRDNFFDYR